MTASTRTYLKTKTKWETTQENHVRQSPDLGLLTVPSPVMCCRRHPPERHQAHIHAIHSLLSLQKEGLGGAVMFPDVTDKIKKISLGEEGIMVPLLL